MEIRTQTPVRNSGSYDWEIKVKNAAVIFPLQQFQANLYKIMEMYCDVLPSNASVICAFWILYIDLLDKSSGGITINDNTLNLTLITLR
jgi:hypothetical protein